MFTQYIVNRLLSTFNKVSHFIFSILFVVFIAIITSSIATRSYAETEDDKDSKVRKAVINQLLVLDGKPKRKKEESKNVKQNSGKALEDTEQSVTTSSEKPTEKLDEKAEKSIKAAVVQPVTTSSNKPLKKQATPLVETLSDKKMQALMLDVMRSPEKPQVTTTTKTATEQKTVKPESQAILVGRTQLGRNTVAETPSKTLTGWIYLGRFSGNKWESQTLDIDQLPEIGKHYVIKATMVNVRTALPKKGVMGKAIKVIKNKVRVKILQLRGLGRNRDHYWARIKHLKN